MDNEADRRKAQWVEAHRDNEVVLAWLEEEPIPSRWLGSPVEYAYEAMPGPDVMIILGIFGERQ